MTFREMTVEDLEQVVEIENRLFSDPWSKEGFFTFLTKENTMFFVIEEKEKILAYCSMQTVLDEGDILNVAVSPDRQREGIGYFLVDSMLKMAEMIGIHIVHLEVREGNGTARRLYERLGFKEDGLRKNYYTETVEEQMAVPVEEMIKKLNAYGQPVTFLGDGVPVFCELITEKMEVPYSFAPAHVNKQRAAAVAALGLIYYREGKTETAMEHVPDYLRVSQAERERAEREAAKADGNA